ncbi:MAG: nucleotide exchange factor GrpE [Bacteroidota bacterium]
MHTILKEMKKDFEKNSVVNSEDGTAYNINTDENMNGNEHLNEPVVDETEIESLKEQIAGLNDRFMRQAAEFDNYKRRTARERIELMQTAGRDVITELLDVLDDSERAQKQLDSTIEIDLAKEGIGLVFSKLRNTLAARGLKTMDVVNQEFNPDVHEAVTEIEAGPDMEGKVVAEVQKGYYLNDKIIRFAKVVVGK